MNKKTRAISTTEYKEIIETMQTGFTGLRPNPRVATALVLEANLGLRISDILKLRLSDFVKERDRYRLDIVEQKTKKVRTFTVPDAIYKYIVEYCFNNEIGREDRIFPIAERTVQDTLKKVCDYLGEEYDGVSTHSFRKFYATEIYEKNGYDVALVQHLLQHSSPAVTQRYLGIEPKRVEDAILGHMNLL